MLAGGLRRGPWVGLAGLHSAAYLGAFRPTRRSCRSAGRISALPRSTQDAEVRRGSEAASSTSFFLQFPATSLHLAAGKFIERYQ